MIDYKRASWYGWSYLLHLEGTVMFKVAPVMLLTGVLGGWSASESGIAQLDKMGSARQIFGETYGVQVFGIVFGYLCIARLNICYSRYCAPRQKPCRTTTTLRGPSSCCHDHGL